MEAQDTKPSRDHDDVPRDNPGAYPQNWCDEREILRADKSRAVVGFHRASCSHRRCEPLFLFPTHKKRSHRREVTYGIAYYTGIIPAGPIRDFSASVWSSLFLFFFFRSLAFCRYSSISSGAYEHMYTRMRPCKSDRNLFLHGVFPLLASRLGGRDGGRRGLELWCSRCRGPKPSFTIRDYARVKYRA